MIQRATTERIRKGLRAYPAVVLLGPRQIGKSTLVLALAKIIKKKNIFLDLEKQSDAVTPDAEIWVMQALSGG